MTGITLHFIFILDCGWMCMQLDKCNNNCFWNNIRKQKCIQWKIFIYFLINMNYYYKVPIIDCINYKIERCINPCSFYVIKLHLSFMHWVLRDGGGEGGVGGWGLVEWVGVWGWNMTNDRETRCTVEVPSTVLYPSLTLYAHYINVN